MKKNVFFFMLGLAPAMVMGQGCSKFAQFKQGTSFTTTSYSAKDKLQGSTKATCTSVSTGGVATTATMKAEGFDKDGKPTHNMEYTLTCKGGIIYIDMKSMTSGNTEAFKGATMTMEGDNLQMPQNLSVGQTLPDAKVKMTFTKDGVQSGTMDMIIRNRKVEGKETITTSAGSFECYKISYETESQMSMMVGTMSMPGFKMTMKALQWYNFENGPIRTESYRGDKLQGYSIMTEIKK